MDPFCIEKGYTHPLVILQIVEEETAKIQVQTFVMRDEWRR